MNLVIGLEERPTLRSTQSFPQFFDSLSQHPPFLIFPDAFEHSLEFTRAET